MLDAGEIEPARDIGEREGKRPRVVSAPRPTEHQDGLKNVKRAGIELRNVIERRVTLAELRPGEPIEAYALSVVAFPLERGDEFFAVSSCS